MSFQAYIDNIKAKTGRTTQEPQVLDTAADTLQERQEPGINEIFERPHGVWLADPVIYRNKFSFLFFNSGSRHKASQNAICEDPGRTSKFLCSDNVIGRP